MSRDHEIQVAHVLEEHLGLSFANSKYEMKPWGQADDWASVSSDTILLLEVETSQKHPNTNVLPPRDLGGV